jgi:hypothetical protein
MDESSATPSKSIIYLHDTIIIRDTTWNIVHSTIDLTLHDTTWLTLNDTITLYIIDTISLPDPVHDTFAIETHVPFDYDTAHYYTLSVLSNNEAMGLAAGNGQFPYGTAVQLGAVAAPGHHFVHWNDGTTDNPKTINVTGDMTYVATFDQGDPVSITSTEQSYTYTVYTQGQRIAVNALAELSITVYNTLGQKVFVRNGHPGHDNTNATTLSQPLQPGLYLVRVGTAPAHKVIILN